MPLLYLYGEYQLSDRWRFIIDFDGLASPQGRALDLGLFARYDINRRWYAGVIAQQHRRPGPFLGGWRTRDRGIRHRR